MQSEDKRIIDVQTLVHIGIELVVVGGLAFWFQKKTSYLQEELDYLRGKTSEYDKILGQQGQILAQHDQILRQIIGGTNLPQSGRPSPSPNPIPNGSPTGQVPSDSGLEPVPSNNGSSPARFQERDLDQFLEEEIDDLHTSSDFIEVECNGDVCELEPSAKHKSSGKRLKKSKKHLKKE